jgi:PAS domain S-box-containing protein
MRHTGAQGGGRDEAVHEAQHRLESILSATSAIAYAAQPGGDFAPTFISSNVTQVTGHELRMFLDDPRFWREHIHPDDRQAVDAALQSLLARGEQSFRYRFRHADGRFHWMHETARLLRNDDGQPKEIVGYWIEIDDLLQAENALRWSDSNFRTLLERSPSAIFVHRGGMLVYVNPSMVAMLGYESPSDLVGTALLDHVHPADREFIQSRMAITARDGGAPVVEGRMLRRDGRTVVVEAEGVLLDFGGEPSNVVLARDVTERREMFARIAVADRMVSVGTLAAGVAHEINNPLAYVMSNLALLARELPLLLRGRGGQAQVSVQEIERILHDAQEGAERVNGILRDLRKLSRADDETLGPVDIVAVLESSLKMAHNETRHRARVFVSIAENVPAVFGNTSRLGQVFLNLLVNAAQSIPDGHIDANEIHVRVFPSADARKVEVEVEDTGAGIPPSIVGRIFDPFFTTKPVGEGTGLGLSICHQIVTSMGGEISVTSVPTGGTCFRLRLPAVAGDEPHADRPTESKRPQAPGVRVLMVDDEPLLGRSTQLLLLPDHDVVPVTRARDALERLRSGERFDVILCDLMMPEMSGIEFDQEVRRVAPEYVGRIVFMTGGAFTDDARNFLATTGTPHLEKPFTEATLRQVIQNVCRSVAP